MLQLILTKFSLKRLKVVIYLGPTTERVKMNKTVNKKCNEKLHHLQTPDDFVMQLQIVLVNL